MFANVLVGIGIALLALIGCIYFRGGKNPPRRMLHLMVLCALLAFGMFRWAYSVQRTEALLDDRGVLFLVLPASMAHVENASGIVRAVDYSYVINSHQYKGSAKLRTVYDASRTVSRQDLEDHCLVIKVSKEDPELSRLVGLARGCPSLEPQDSTSFDVSIIDSKGWLGQSR